MLKISVDNENKLVIEQEKSNVQSLFEQAIAKIPKLIENGLDVEGKRLQLIEEQKKSNIEHCDICGLSRSFWKICDNLYLVCHQCKTTELIMAGCNEENVNVEETAYALAIIGDYK